MKLQNLIANTNSATNRPKKADKGEKDKNKGDKDKDATESQAKTDEGGAPGAGNMHSAYLTYLGNEH